jgi:hypothetical protein
MVAGIDDDGAGRLAGGVGDDLAQIALVDLLPSTAGIAWPPSFAAAYIRAGAARPVAGGSAGAGPSRRGRGLVVQPARAAEATETDAAAISERREIEGRSKAAVTSAPWGRLRLKI